MGRKAMAMFRCQPVDRKGIAAVTSSDLLRAATLALALVSIVAAAVREGNLAPGAVPTPMRKRRVPFATADRLLADDIEVAAQVIRTPAVQTLTDFLLPSFG